MHPLIGLGLFTVFISWLLNDKDSKMPAVQKQFDEFHSSIKFDEDDEKANLREKRDTLINALKLKLADDVPSFEYFNQGSYSMHTGVVPLDGDYDIDVGLIFDCNRDKYPDPVELKKKVRDAIDTHNRTVKIRRPCVTVNYIKNGSSEYHVDLVVYVKRDDGKLDLAKGKENSQVDMRVWESSDPKELTETICSAFSEANDRQQFRRCIRYIKRWRAIQFSSGAPLSIALTVAAYKWFDPHKTVSGNYLDLLAMQDWVNSMLGQFSSYWTDDGWQDRLKVELPVEPYSDLMGWMTKAQMDTFKLRLESLRDALSDAYDEELPEDACKLLTKQFGSDFKVPEKAETAKSVAAPVIHTGNAA